MAKVTKNDVQNAINSLRVDGKAPTNKAIREIIGSGSNSTINKYRKEILDNETSEVVKKVNTLQDDEVRKLGDLFAQLLVNRTDELGREYQHRVEISDKQNEELSKQLDNAQRKIDKLRQEKQELQDSSKILVNDVTKLEQQVIEQNEEIKQLYQKVGKVEILEEQLKLLQQQLNQSRAELVAVMKK